MTVSPTYSMRIVLAGTLAGLSFISGCGSPDKANIALRKEKESLHEQVAKLTTEQIGDRATIRGYESKSPTTQSLTTDRLAKLFTVHDLSIGRLTGDDFWAKPGASGLKVYVVPVDEDGTAIKAAGSFTVEAFDLDIAEKPMVGSWNFDVDQARGQFYAHLSLYTYVLPCPWKTLPSHGDLTLRVTFRDELTGREFTKQTEVKIKLSPPATPAT